MCLRLRSIECTGLKEYLSYISISPICIKFRELGCVKSAAADLM